MTLNYEIQYIYHPEPACRQTGLSKGEKCDKFIIVRQAHYDKFSYFVIQRTEIKFNFIKCSIFLKNK